MSQKSQPKLTYKEFMAAQAYYNNKPEKKHDEKVELDRQNEYPYLCVICEKVFDTEKDGIFTCGEGEIGDNICPTCYQGIKKYDDKIKAAFKEYYEVLERLQKGNDEK